MAPAAVCKRIARNAQTARRMSELPPYAARYLMGATAKKFTTKEQGKRGRYHLIPAVRCVGFCACPGSPEPSAPACPITQRGNRREEVFLTDEDRRAYLAWLKDYAEEDYLWAAVRYVERNPVRAKIVRKAENYRWSSTSAHCGLKADPLLTRKPSWRRQFESIGDWPAWLAEGDEPQRLEILRRNVEKGLPCGSAKFIRKLEKLTGRALQYRPRGRPKKESDK